MFKLAKRSKISNARLGRLQTAHGTVPTPVFMPVATQGTVKHLSAEDMRRLKAGILLANTYHLMLRPGEKLVRRAGGLHRFMDWSGPLLTDSGGFQVFSLAGTKNRPGESLVKLTDRAVEFKSYIDGRAYRLTPEKALRIQLDLGVDIAVCLDVCVKLPAAQAELRRAVGLTSAWARRTKAYSEKCLNKNLVFAVVQGGLNEKLRALSLAELAAMDFDGYNIGGLAVGETPAERRQVLKWLLPALPENKPRYLMGVGYPEDILAAVRDGADMFDCVIPTREGRHGRIFSFRKKSKFSIFNFQFSNKKFYEADNVKTSKFARDFVPINPESKIPELRRLSKSYLHHLFRINEPLAARLATLNNLEFYLDLMGRIRYGIQTGAL